jgi:putative pyrroloquinoline-quinone binding quinoprotein
MVRLLALALLGCAALLSVPAANARADAGDLLWQAAFDVAGGQEGATAVAAADGRVVVVGRAQNAAGNRDLVVRAHDAKTGGILWEDRLDIAGGDDEALSVVMDNQRVIVAGTGSDMTGTSRALIRAYSAGTGALGWADGWPGSGAGLALDGARLIVAGNIVNSAGATQLLVRAYIARTGIVAWEDRSVPAGYSRVVFQASPSSGHEARAVALNRGQAFVSATVAPAGEFGGTACLVRGYDATTGDRLWEAAHHVSGNCTPAGVAIAGRRVILGATGGIGGDNLVVQAYDAGTGDLLWQERTFVGSGFDNAVTAVDTDGRRAFIAAWDNHIPWTTGGLKEAFIVRSYDTETGVLLWENVHHVDALGFYLWHALDVETEKGRVFAVGQDVGHGTWLVRAYDAKHGDVLWQDESELGGTDYSATQAVAVDRGRVFVGGTGANAVGGVDLILRAYDAE